MTSLSIREKLMIDLQEQLSAKRATTLAVLFVDFDDFKHINDNYGHNVGDIFMVHLSELLRKELPIYIEPDYR
ncbi:diguanylate cyclase, partial [Vibrio parahaemolyticus]|nr:diguanylate cyclase [Vibrio parahaemolyticus]